MRYKALRGLLGLIIVFAAGGGQRDGFNLVVQQIGIIGPRQWVGMAGAIVASARDRPADLPRKAGPVADIGVSVIYAG